MGKWSRPVNAIAITWVLFISVVLFFPPERPVTAANMNYAICVAGAIAAISLSWWFISAKEYVLKCNERIGVELTTAANTPGRAPRRSSSKFRPTTQTSSRRTHLETANPIGNTLISTAVCRAISRQIRIPRTTSGPAVHLHHQLETFRYPH
jgi:Na+/melibiose symporter-like transporter